MRECGLLVHPIAKTPAPNLIHTLSHFSYVVCKASLNNILLFCRELDVYLALQKMITVLQGRWQAVRHSQSCFNYVSDQPCRPIGVIVSIDYISSVRKIGIDSIVKPRNMITQGMNDHTFVYTVFHFAPSCAHLRDSRASPLSNALPSSALSHRSPEPA